MTCFDIYGVNIYVSKHKFNSFEKNVWYSYDFRWFPLKFSMILADFLLPGYGSVSLKRVQIRLIKMKRIQTDPVPKQNYRKKHSHWGNFIRLVVCPNFGHHALTCRWKLVLQQLWMDCQFWKCVNLEWGSSGRVSKLWQTTLTNNQIIILSDIYQIYVSDLNRKSQCGSQFR